VKGKQMSNQPTDDETGQPRCKQQRLAALQLEEAFRGTIHPAPPDAPEGPAEQSYRAALPSLGNVEPLSGKTQLDNAAAFEKAAAVQAELDAEVASQIAVAGAEEEGAFKESNHIPE
jgi:hypothetical protein